MSERATIFVVDDDPDLRAAVIDVLEEEGYQTLAAENGQVALDLLERATEVPDLILLDVMMPVMNGLTFATELKKVPRLATIPVVLFSAHSEYERIAATVQAAASLAKPLKLETLLAVVDGVLKPLREERSSSYRDGPCVPK